MTAVLVMLILLSIPALAQNNYRPDTRNIYQGMGDRVSVGRDVYSPEPVNGSATAIGGNSQVENGANGDVVAILGNAQAKGTVNGNVVAIAGNATVDGNVNGDVVAIGGRVILKDKTVVNGQVVCSEIRKSDSAVIRGGIVQTPIPLFKAPAGFRSLVTDGWWVFNPIRIWFKIFSLVVLNSYRSWAV